MAKNPLKIVSKYKKKLESCNNHEVVKRTLLKLLKLPITYEILAETRIGWTVGMLQKKHAVYKVLTKPLIRKWKTLVKESNDCITTAALKDNGVKKPAENPTSKKEVKANTEKIKSFKQTSFGEALNNNQPKGKKKKIFPTVVDGSLDIQKRLYQIVDYVKSKKPVMTAHSSQDVNLLSDEEFMKLSTSRKRGRTALLPFESEDSTDNSGFLQNHVDCIEFLTKNIEVIANMKLCLPFKTVRPILENCNAVQLNQIEARNKKYLKHTNYIWKQLCKKDFEKKLTVENKSLAWKSVYEKLSKHREDKMLAVKNKILNNLKKRDQAKNRIVLVEVGGLKKNRCKETETSSSSFIRPVVVGSTSYRRPVEPEKFKTEKKKVAPLMADAREQFRNRFRR